MCPIMVQVTSQALQKVRKRTAEKMSSDDCRKLAGKVQVKRDVARYFVPDTKSSIRKSSVADSRQPYDLSTTFHFILIIC